MVHFGRTIDRFAPKRQYEISKYSQELRDLGNTVLVVEHDQETMEEADWLIDMGPGAGVHGGTVVCSGTPADVAKNKNSLTGKILIRKSFYSDSDHSSLWQRQKIKNYQCERE